MRIHPLMAGAAVSIIVLSGVGVAAMTGYLPGSRAEKSAEPITAESPKEQAAATLAPTPAAKPAKAVCNDCGVVVAVRQTDVKGEGTGLGAVVGGVAGAVVGNKIGNGRDAGTLLGAAGGAVAGHQIERHARTTQRFHVDVRMTDGTVKTVTFDAAPTWRSGDRVRLRGGTLIARG